MTELQLGVVGLGARSTVAKHVDRPGEGSVVVAVCDPVPAQRESSTANYPRAKAYPDHRDLLDLGLDGVFLTTPDHLHEQPAIDFLTAGVSVFVEKPLAITTEAATGYWRPPPSTAAGCTSGTTCGTCRWCSPCAS